jgi:hypothetical protein
MFQAKETGALRCRPADCLFNGISRFHHEFQFLDQGYAMPDPECSCVSSGSKPDSKIPGPAHLLQLGLQYSGRRLRLRTPGIMCAQGFHGKCGRDPKNLPVGHPFHIVLTHEVAVFY